MFIDYAVLKVAAKVQYSTVLYSTFLDCLCCNYSVQYLCAEHLSMYSQEAIQCQMMRLYCSSTYHGKFKECELPPFSLCSVHSLLSSSQEEPVHVARTAEEMGIPGLTFYHDFITRDEEKVCPLTPTVTPRTRTVIQSNVVRVRGQQRCRLRAVHANELTAVPVRIHRLASLPSLLFFTAPLFRVILPPVCHGEGLLPFHCHAPSPLTLPL